MNSIAIQVEGIEDYSFDFGDFERLDKMLKIFEEKAKDFESLIISSGDLVLQKNLDGVCAVYLGPVVVSTEEAKDIVYFVNLDSWTASFSALSVLVKDGPDQS